MQVGHAGRQVHNQPAIGLKIPLKVRCMTDILQLLTPQLMPLEPFLAPRDYLPHDNPMIFIDEILAVQSDAIVTRTYIAPQHNLMLFQDPKGVVPSHFGLEVMAQSIGAWSGYQRIKRHEPPLKVGMLLSVRNFNCTQDQLKAGCVLTTVMRMLLNDGKCGTFEGMIYLKSNPTLKTVTSKAPSQIEPSAPANPTEPMAAAAPAPHASFTLPESHIQLSLPMQQALGGPFSSGRLTTIEVEDHELAALL